MGINNIFSNIDAVIFDLDGTIVDSMWMWGQIDIEYLKVLNLECPTDLQKCIEGMSFYETAVYFKERFKINDSVEEIMKIWNDMAYEKYLHEVPLKDGFFEFINYLKDEGYKLGVATSNSRVLTKAALSGHSIYAYFDVIITGDEVSKGKPEPDVYLCAASGLGVVPSKCLVFEDLPAGIKAGKNAGMCTVAISDDYSKFAWEIKKQLADFYILDYREIIDEICNS